jgi:hypothetical protein
VKLKTKCLQRCVIFRAVLRGTFHQPSPIAELPLFSKFKTGHFAACVLLMIVSGLADAHPGRRFKVQIVDRQLVAQGVNTLETPPMGETPTRPYANIIHDHFANLSINGDPMAYANLPGFDLPAELKALHGYRVMLRVDQVFEISEAAGTSPQKIADSLQPISAPRKLTISINEGSADSLELPGELTLSNTVPAQGSFDLDPHYQINFTVSDSFVVVVMTLMTTAPDIRPSAPVWVVLTPPGFKFHHSALRLENRIAQEMSASP